MACNLCDSCDDDTERPAPTGGKYCGHKDSCDCKIPEAKDPPAPCTDDGGDGGADCDPDARIRELEQIEETAKAEAAEATAARENIVKLRDGHNTAIQEFNGDAENRKKRKSECCEFIRCKRPNLPDDVEECVDEQIDKVCAYVNVLDERARYLHWAWGDAKLQVSWRQWEYDRLIDEYEQLKLLATACHAECEQARTKYDEACAADDEKRKLLYWKLAKRLADRAAECCDDYPGKLCEVFDALVEASKVLGEAKREAESLSAQLETVKKERKQYGSRDHLWGKIAKLVDTCCKCGDDSDSHHQEPQDKSTQQPSC